MRHSLKKQRNEVYFERAYDELVSCVEMEKEGVIDLYYSCYALTAFRV